MAVETLRRPSLTPISSPESIPISSQFTPAEKAALDQVQRKFTQSQSPLSAVYSEVSLVEPHNLLTQNSGEQTVIDFTTQKKEPDLSFKAWKEAKMRREEAGEVKEREYGAFVQCQVKDGDGISYRSLGLPRGTTSEMVQKIITTALPPNGISQQDSMPKLFGDGELAVMARRGADYRVADRMVAAAYQVIRTDHPNQEDPSVIKFYKKLPLIYQELQETGGRMIAYTDGKARIADGVHIHHGSYVMEGKTATGLDINGEPWDLRKIARDPGHKNQMNEVVNIFAKNAQVTVMVGDASTSVGECKEACADYYDWKASIGKQFSKEQSIAVIRADTTVNRYAAHVAQLLHGAGEKQVLCKQCKKPKDACDGHDAAKETTADAA